MYETQEQMLSLFPHNFIFKNLKKGDIKNEN